MKWLVGAIVIAGAANVSADSDDADDRKEATRLFEEGRRLDDSGDYDAACKKFETSYKLDPAPGTALNLAACAERAQQWRRAWELYDEAATVFVRKSDNRARFARERADHVLDAHRDDVEAKPWDPNARAETPAPPPQRESRTGLKVLTGVSLGLAAAGSIWWFTSYLTINDFPEGSLEGIDGPLTVPEDCGTIFVDPLDPNLGRFEDACDAHARLGWLVPATLVAAVVGGSLLTYLIVSEPKPVTVVPSVSGTSAGVTATFEW